MSTDTNTGGETDPSVGPDPGAVVFDADLPDGVTVDAVATAVANNQYLREVANDLGLSEGGARSAVFRLDLYSDIKEGGGYR